MPDFAGSLYNNAGVARDTAADTVAIFTDATEATDTTATASATALTQTDSAGDWSSLSVADGIYDVRITDGSSVRWRRYNDRVQLREMWVGELSVVNQTNGVSNQILLLRGNNSTRAANDEIFVSMSMEDSGGGETEFCRISAVGTTVTATSEAGRLDFAVMSAGTLADELQLTGTALAPSANDGIALGTTSLGYSDVFLAAGGVINWANGEITITETDANTLTIAGVATVLDLAAGILELNDAVRFDTGVAIVAASYSLGRDVDVTNQLHLNVPTGATFELSVNDVAEYTFSATTFNINGNTITNTGVLTLPTATDTLVGRDTTDTLTNKTLTTPTIVATGWANANHTHAGSTTGGQVSQADLNPRTGIVKCWANFDGDSVPAALRTSLNVTSLTDTAVGRYGVVIATDFADSYVVSGSAGFYVFSGENASLPYAVGQADIATYDYAGVNADTNTVTVMMVGT